MARPNFVEKTFMGGSKTMKFVNVFSLESFPLYCMYVHEQWPAVGTINGRGYHVQQKGAVCDTHGLC